MRDTNISRSHNIADSIHRECKEQRSGNISIYKRVISLLFALISSSSTNFSDKLL